MDGSSSREFDARVVRNVTERAIATLELAVGELSTLLPAPKQTSVGDDFVWELSDESGDAVIFLKTVRVASGINACLSLIDSGYVQEAGVLIRTIDEFVGEIGFLLDGYGTEHWPSGKQRDFVEHFYSVRTSKVNPGTGTLSDVPWVGRKKRQAGEARLISPAEPHTPTEALRRIDSAYDAYVHAYYGAVMEMYAGPQRGYRLRGMPETRATRQKLRELSFYVDRLMGYLALYSHARGLHELADRLDSERDRYQQIAGSAANLDVR